MIYQGSIYAIPQLCFGNGPYSYHYHGTTTTSEMDQSTSVAMEVAWYYQQMIWVGVIASMAYIPYPRYCSPWVLFFDMGFWVRVNRKNPSKSGLFEQKVGVYSRNTQKTGLFTLPGGLFKSGAAISRIL